MELEGAPATDELEDAAGDEEGAELGGIDGEFAELGGSPGEPVA